MCFVIFCYTLHYYAIENVEEESIHGGLLIDAVNVTIVGFFYSLVDVFI